ncbi:MAG: hypothetical protein OEY92_02610 [Elusimicrobiota bacterium]|nr:hypothetical protein [Elusimicrobiota bacterium]
MARKLKDEDMFRDEEIFGAREIKEYLEKLKLSASELEEMLLDVLEESFQEDYDPKGRKKQLH